MSGFLICLITLVIGQGFEYASVIKYASILNIAQYSYNNIIIVTNVIILEFLSARFVHSDAPQLTILFFLTLIRT